MKELQRVHQKYITHAERIYKRAGDKPLTEAQQRGVNYYVCSAEAVAALIAQ
jgi:hypothetical protein